MRRLLTIVAAIMLAAVAALVAASPAQAHPIYRRAFGSPAGGCLWGGDWNSLPYRDACGKTPNTAAKWNIHVVADDYGPDSHEVWVLENIAYPSTCIDVITGYDSPQPSPVMASCAYTGEQPSRFEAFYLGKNANGVSVYEMKSIYDWDLYRSYGDRCLANGIGEYYVQLRPCNSPDTTWSVTAAA